MQITTARAAGINPTASATGSQTLTALLAQLEDAFRGQGDGETTEKVAHLATLVESTHRDESKIQRLWSAIKIAATTNEVVTLVGHIVPLLGAVAHHQVSAQRRAVRERFASQSKVLERSPLPLPRTTSPFPRAGRSVTDGEGE